MTDKAVFFIRHGLAHDNVPLGGFIYTLDNLIIPSKGKILSGRNSSPLTALGMYQAVAAGMYLLQRFGRERLKTALWVKSPQLRVEQTYVGVLAGAELDPDQLVIVTDPRFQERDAGTCTGQTQEEAVKNFANLPRVFFSAAESYPAGESLADVHRRAMEAIGTYLQINDLVIVLSHELTIKAMVHGLTVGGITDAAFRIEVPNGMPIELVQDIHRVWKAR